MTVEPGVHLFETWSAQLVMPAQSATSIIKYKRAGVVGYIVSAGMPNENPSGCTHSALVNVSDSRRFCPSCPSDFGGRHVAGRMLAEEPKCCMHIESGLTKP